MKSNYLNWLLLLVFLIGIIGSGLLVYDELTIENVCPKLLGVPACYLILVCFIVPFVVHFIKGKSVIYYLFSGVAFTIALFASILQFFGFADCPKTSSGMPMCYYSLLLFTSIIILKRIIDVRKIA